MVHIYQVIYTTIQYIIYLYTFFFAFSKLDLSRTENIIKNTSQLEYANGLRLPYYYCPAVSLENINIYIYHKPKLIFFLFTLTTTE